MEVNKDLTIPKVDVREDMEDQTKVEIQEMIEVEVEKDLTIKAAKIATADVVDGNSCKT